MVNGALYIQECACVCLSVIKSRVVCQCTCVFIHRYTSADIRYCVPIPLLRFANKIISCFEIESQSVLCEKVHAGWANLISSNWSLCAIEVLMDPKQQQYVNMNENYKSHSNTL